MLYVHRFNRLRAAASAEFYEGVSKRGLPAFSAAGVRLAGYWETLEEQGPWPETVELWEYDGFSHLAAVQQARRSDPDHPLARWSAEQSRWIESSQSYVCLKSDLTPTVAQRDGAPAPVLALHETMTVASTRQAEYLRALEDWYFPRVAQPAGRTMIGLYWSPWKATKAFNLWGMGDDWSAAVLARDESGLFPGRDTELWVTLGREIRTDWDDRLLVPVALAAAGG